MNKTTLRPKKKFNRNKAIFNITVTAILSALGSILMIVGTNLPYPVAPFLKLEPSDTVILVAYAICGLPSAAACALIKALLEMLINGPTGPIAIGQITAFLTSLLYVFGLFLCSHIFKLFRKGLIGRIISYVVIITIVASLMTILNYLFITPTFLSQKPTTCFNPDFLGNFSNPALPFKGPFFWVVFATYFPFNLLKGLIVCVLYELLFNRVIFSYLKNSKFYSKINTKKAQAKPRESNITTDVSVDISEEEKKDIQN